MLHDRKFKRLAVYGFCQVSGKSLFNVKILSEGRIGGKCIYRQIRMVLPDHSDRFHSVHARHHMIEKHDIEASVFDLVKTLFPA